MNIIQQVEFPDVSFYQGDINFDKMGQVAIFRAGQGNFVDSKFERNRTEAGAHGMTWGAYWFYDDRYSPGNQAKALYNLFSAGQARPQMEIYCDWENTYNGTYGSISNVVAFMQEVERLMPWVKIGMYTGYFWFTDHAIKATAAQLAYLKSKPLWLAWYTTNPAEVLIPKPWASCNIWQYGTPVRGAEFGTETKEIDMNWYNGTAEQFAAQYGGAVIIPPPVIPPVIPPTQEFTVKGTAKYITNVKSLDPADGGKVIAQMQIGDYAYGDKGTTDLMNFTHFYRANGSKFELGKPCKATLSNLTLTNEAEPVTPPIDPPPAVTGWPVKLTATNADGTTKDYFPNA